MEQCLAVTNELCVGSGSVLNDRFKLERMIDKTKKSVVFLATDLSNESDVAVKIIPCESVGSCMELSIHLSLTHPNIVSIIDHFQICQFHCIVMPFARHGSLATLLRHKYPLGIKKRMARVIFSQMLSVLSYLHCEEIIHSDIKLENFLVFDASEVSPRIALTDFGISRRATQLVATPKTSRGTLEYCSPEICKSETYTNKTDIWSLGVAFYTLLCAKRPFDSQRTANRKAVAMNIVNRRLEYPRKVWSDLEAPRRLIDKMLVVDPDLRITAEEALADEWITKTPK